MNRLWEIGPRYNLTVPFARVVGMNTEIIGSFLDNGIEYPAVGITFGLDVIYAALSCNDIKTYKSPVQVYIIQISTQIWMAIINLLPF